MAKTEIHIHYSEWPAAPLGVESARSVEKHTPDKDWPAEPLALGDLISIHDTEAGSQDVLPARRISQAFKDFVLASMQSGDTDRRF